jgi:predicted amidohydrolase YtcJ
MRRKSGVSRRDFLKTSALASAAAATGGGLAVGVVHATEKAKRHRKRGSLILVNGRIHTMDDRGSVVSAVAIRRGRFVGVGHDARDFRSNARVIDLRGRTVVPGLVESHTHFVSLANRPGYHVAQWELANTVADVLAILKARRARGDVPVGGFITAMGAGTPNIWFERRQPTLAELDSAVSDRPVFLYFGGGGPARVNSLGRDFFRSVSNPTVTVQDDGAILGGNPNQANAALYHLRIRQTFEDKKRSCLDAQAYTAQIGVTTLLDQTLVAVATGTLQPETLDPQPNHALFNLNHFRMYDAWLALHAEGRNIARLQMNFLHNQGFIPELGSDIAKQLPELRERLKNQFQFFGDDMLRTGAIGEWAAPFATPANANGYAVWFEAQRLCAKARWRNENSQPGVPSASEADDSQVNIEQVVGTYEAMHAEALLERWPDGTLKYPDGLRSLRWGLQHADHATAGQLARLRALNCGVSASGFRWTSAPRTDGLPVGPRFPRLVASGIPLALHQDGVHITAHNPWFAMHYATTGLNNIVSAANPQGQQINPGQQISRQQALHMYTRGASWYLNREDELGQIKEGYLADLVVLDRDYFRVSDADMRNTRPVLTVVDGKVVHDSGVLDDRGGGHDDDDDDDDGGGRGHGRR